MPSFMEFMIFCLLFPWTILATPIATVIVAHSPLKGRIIYTAISLLSLVVLTILTYQRVSSLFGPKPRRLNLTKVLILSIYFDAILFVVSGRFLVGAWDLASATTCRAGIYLCLVFYVGGKVLLYVYLVERMASIQEEEERIKMPLFWLGLAAVGLGFGTIAIVAFLFPVVDISPVDGRCRIGLPLKVTIPLLSYDIVLNFGLCGVFFRTCQKHTGTTRTRGLWQRVFSDLPFVHPTLIASTPPLRLEILAYRCLMGACAIVIPTTANLVILFRIHGREQGWLCFTICTIDITWQAIIIHWVSSDIETPADVHAARELAQAEENRLRRFERHVKKEEHRARQQQDRPPQDRQSRSGHHHHSSPPPSPSSSRSGFQPQRLHGGRGTGEEGIELIPMNRS